MVNVLAIGAHPDDIELGCSATLSRLIKQGCDVFLLILSMGEASGDPKIREEECRRSAELLGAERIFFGGLEDTKIGDGIETIQVIDDVINEVEAEAIWLLLSYFRIRTYCILLLRWLKRRLRNVLTQIF